MTKKLLVVDSNLAIQKLVEYNLTRENFEVTSLNDGLTALDLLSKIDPDLILVDYHLEGINFLRFCEKIKQKQSGKERPILVLVGATDGYDPNKLVSLGVVDFVKKPLEPKELIAKLKELSQDTATVIDQAPKPVSSAPAAPPVEPAPAAQAPAPSQRIQREQAEAMKMEELLGWSLPTEKQVEEATRLTTGPWVEPDNETTQLQRPSEGTAPPFQEEARPMIEDAESTMVATNSPAAVPTQPDSYPESETREASSPPTTPATLEAAFPHLYAEPEIPEAPSATAPSARAGAQPAPLVDVSPEIIEAVVSKIAKEIIEKVAWDVVPSLAETLINEELEKLRNDKPA